ncbi:unnamed protein product [Moneuplotes crassus]|uniref:Uncharacterized protein n=1 Tax=Euplotes crassus TaxID=5936 RepID=A0AAD1ULL6_EUPCR|nr:unnamed protein product [Moneuplotes crassus]
MSKAQSFKKKELYTSTSLTDLADLSPKIKEEDSICEVGSKHSTRSTGSSDISSSEIPVSKLGKPVNFNVGITGVKIIDKSTSRIYVDKPSYTSTLTKRRTPLKGASIRSKRRMTILQKSVAARINLRRKYETDVKIQTLQLNDFPVYIYNKSRIEDTEAKMHKVHKKINSGFLKCCKILNSNSNSSDGIKRCTSSTKRRFSNSSSKAIYKDVGYTDDYKLLSDTQTCKKFQRGRLKFSQLKMHTEMEDSPIRMGSTIHEFSHKKQGFYPKNSQESMLSFQKTQKFQHVSAWPNQLRDFMSVSMSRSPLKSSSRGYNTDLVAKYLQKYTNFTKGNTNQPIKTMTKDNRNHEDPCKKFLKSRLSKKKPRNLISIIRDRDCSDDLEVYQSAKSKVQWTISRVNPIRSI